MWTLFGHRGNRTVAQPSPQNHSNKSSQLAEVVDTILPERHGQVLFRGIYWNAELFDPNCRMAIFPGELVQVVDARCLPLLVMPLD